MEDGTLEALDKRCTELGCTKVGVPYQQNISGRVNVNSKTSILGEENLIHKNVIAITSGKGGVGKTTVAANLGVALALQGKKVVLVDADIGLRNLDIVLALENHIVYDLSDVVEGRCRCTQALIKDSRFEGLFLLPASQSRESNDKISVQQMKALCNTLIEKFDYVIIDCPAGIEKGFINTVAGSGRALVVTQPDVASVRDADRVIGLLENAGLANIQLIVNRVVKESIKKGDMMTIEDIVEILAIDLIGVVQDDVNNVTTSINQGKPLVLFNGSLSGKALSNIARRINGEEVAFIELNQTNTINVISKIKRLFKL